MQDLSHVCDLYHSSWQCWILNPLSKARDQTCILMDTGCFINHWATMGTLQISYQNARDILQRIRTNNPKIYMEPQKTQNCQSNSEEKEQSWRHNFLRLQTILQSYNNQNSMILAQKQTYGLIEQNRKPRNKTDTYGKLIFNSRGKNIYNGEKNLFSKWCWECWTATCKSMKLEYTLTPYTKINMGWFDDLNMTP